MFNQLSGGNQIETRIWKTRLFEFTVEHLQTGFAANPDSCRIELNSLTAPAKGIHMSYKATIPTPDIQCTATGDEWQGILVVEQSNDPGEQAIRQLRCCQVRIAVMIFQNRCFGRAKRFLSSKGRILIIFIGVEGCDL